VGRVCPRHGHRGRPFNRIVSWHSMNKSDTVPSSNSRFVSCVILCARNADGFSASDGYAIRDFFDNADCDGWWFVPTGTFIAVFEAEKSGVKRASDCESGLRGLKSWGHSLAFGHGEGELLCTFTGAGELAQLPMGLAINDAINEAVRNAS